MENVVRVGKKIMLHPKNHQSEILDELIAGGDKVPCFFEDEGLLKIYGVRCLVVVPKNLNNKFGFGILFKGKITKSTKGSYCLSYGYPPKQKGFVSG